MCRYLAPEYAENGIVSVRTDVYSFGIVLIQLISGRKAVDSAREDQQSLRQWVRCLEDFSIFLKNENLFTMQLIYLEVNFVILAKHLGNCSGVFGI